MIVLGVVLVAYLLIPMIKNTTDSQIDQDTLIKVNATAWENFTLEKTPMESASLTITGLVVTANYTIDYTTALVTINNATANASYTATYYYYEPGYLENAGERSLMAIGIIACMIGLLMFLFNLFGVTGKD